MLDLEMLRKEISDALEQETKESLTSWLLKKRSENIESYIGVGNFVSCNFNSLQSSVQIEVKSSKVVLTETVSDTTGLTEGIHYDMAA